MLELNDQGTPYRQNLPSPSTVALVDLVRALGAPASRFRKPWTIRDRALLWFSEAAIRNGALRDLEVPVTSSVPLHWQPILNFLYRHGALERPGFDLPVFRNDMPKALSVTFRSKDGGAKQVVSHASGYDLDETISKALGEFLERYSAGLIERSDCTYGSIVELERRNVRFVDPRTLCQFSREQHARFERFRYDENTPLHWLSAVELRSGTPHLMPAQVVRYPFRALVPDEPLLNPPTSNGTAGHFSCEEAILSGLKELIQRDAFLIYWLNSLTPNRIEVESVDDPHFQELLAYARSCGSDLHFLDLRTDLAVATVVCVAIAHKKDGPIVTVGAGNGATPLEALERSYFEAIPALSLDARPLPVDPASSTYEPFSNPGIGKLERITLWRGQAWLERLGFLLNGPKEPFGAFAAQFSPHTSPSEELRVLTNIFAQRGPGYEIYVHEISNPLIRELGYHVVQVRVPKLVPMYLSEHQAPLDAERLFSVPNSLGMPAKRNVYPHPFP